MTGRAIQTFGSSGVILPEFNKPFYLLPLLSPSPSHAVEISRPPIERLPNGHPRPDRIAFTSATETPTQSNSRVTHTTWVSSTHLYPAAYPRSHFASTAPPSAQPPPPTPSSAQETKDQERERRIEDFAAYDDLVSRFSIESYYPPESKQEAKKIAESLVAEAPPQLWGAVQRLVPIKTGANANKERLQTEQQGPGLTLIMAHANGFHKEIWEPTLEQVIKSLEAESSNGENETAIPNIDEIWSIDCSNAGDAGALNAPHLGAAVSWFDHPRDILQFLDFYIPPSTASHSKNSEGKGVAGDLASLGPGWPSATLRKTRKGEGRKHRRLVGIGHSFSGAALSLLSNTIPDLFESVVVLDPVVNPPESLATYPNLIDVPLSKGAIARKDVFAGRQDAAKYFNSKPFFQAWNPKVLSIHLRFGLRPLDKAPHRDDPSLTLNMSKWAEAFAFASSWMGRFVYALIRGDCKAYIEGADTTEARGFEGNCHIVTMQETTFYSDSDNEAEKLRTIFVNKMKERGAKRASSESMPGNHLVAQEQPKELGDKLARLLCDWERGKGKTSFPRPRL